MTEQKELNTVCSASPPKGKVFFMTKDSIIKGILA